MENLDFEKMFGNLKEVFDRQMELQETYFTILREMNETRKYSDLVSNRIMNLKMTDQIEILKHYLAIGKISEKMCKKYGWDDEIQTD